MCDVNPSAFSSSFDISFKRGLKRTYSFDEKELGGFPLNVASFSPHARKFYARNFN